MLIRHAKTHRLSMLGMRGIGDLVIEPFYDTLFSVVRQCIELRFPVL